VTLEDRLNAPAMSDDILRVRWDRRRHRYFWGTDEERVLREHYGSPGGPAHCAELLGRSIHAVYERAQRLGLRGVRHVFERPAARRYNIEPWIDAEIRRVFLDPPYRNAVKELAARVGRPRWWVSKRALALGLNYPRFKEPAWSAAEIELLRRLAHYVPREIMRKFRASGFSRSETAIVIKRKRLDLDLRDPDHFTAGQLARLMGVDPTTVLRWIEREGLAASRRGTQRVAAQGGDMHWIARRDLRAWIARHAQLVDLRKVDRFWFIDLAFGAARTV
jgi:hypothetical protein